MHGFYCFSRPGISFWIPKMGPKWGPNRIFDAEPPRKPLGGLLERSWRPLEQKEVSLEASWRLSAGDLGDVGGRHGKKDAEKTQARRNAQACSRWFTIDSSLTSIILLQEHSKTRSNTHGSPVGGGGFNRYAHSAGPGALDRGPLAKEPSARIRDQHGGNIASN